MSKKKKSVKVSELIGKVNFSSAGFDFSESNDSQEDGPTPDEVNVELNQELTSEQVSEQALDSRQKADQELTGNALVDELNSNLNDISEDLLIVDDQIEVVKEPGVELTEESVLALKKEKNTKSTSQVDSKDNSKSLKAKKKSKKRNKKNISNKNANTSLVAKSEDNTNSEQKTTLASEASDIEETTSQDEENIINMNEKGHDEKSADNLTSAEINTEQDFELEVQDQEENKPELEFIERDRVLSVLESFLFSTDRPISLSQIKNLFSTYDLSTDQIKSAINELEISYAEPNRGVCLEEVKGGYQLRTKQDNAFYLKKSVKRKIFRLSGPSMEALSIIAYRQPIIKSEIDEVRGVESGHLIRALMDKGLACFMGKSELPGKPMQYGTTKKFLEIFGLKSLNELPPLSEIEQLIPVGIGDEEEKEHLSDITDNMSEEVENEYSQAEEDLNKIESELSEISTSSDFFEEEKRKQKEKRDQQRALDIQEAMDVGEDISKSDQRWLTKYLALKAESESLDLVVQQDQEESSDEVVEKRVDESELALEAESNEQLDDLTADTNILSVEDVNNNSGLDL